MSGPLAKLMLIIRTWILFRKIRLYNEQACSVCIFLLVLPPRSFVLSTWEADNSSAHIVCWHFILRCRALSVHFFHDFHSCLRLPYSRPPSLGCCESCHPSTEAFSCHSLSPLLLLRASTPSPRFFAALCCLKLIASNIHLPSGPPLLSGGWGRGGFHKRVLKCRALFKSWRQPGTSSIQQLSLRC